MALSKEVVERLLLSKSLLNRARYERLVTIDRHTLASNILASHDAAELAVAAVCDALGCLPQNRGNAYLMQYLAALQDYFKHKRQIHGRHYLHNLNDTRNLLKHKGLYPDASQWSHVAGEVFEIIQAWCSEYLKESFSDLDFSVLIASSLVKGMYDLAYRDYQSSDYKSALEHLAIALSVVFTTNNALSYFEAGNSTPEDAIRIAGFGVHANDFLLLQQFLPHVGRFGQPVPRWKQSAYGHPANWTGENVAFCLQTFVDIVVKIQSAPRLPFPLLRDWIYQQEIEALSDDVELWREVDRVPPANSPRPLLTPDDIERVVVKKLSKGEKLAVNVSGLSSESSSERLYRELFYPNTSSQNAVLDIIILGEGEFTTAKVRVADIRVMNIQKPPNPGELVRDVPSFEWKPE